MKRKGFTLVELLIVIGVMGTLSALAMTAGQEATDAAKATNIADGLEKASIAMMAYYADNSDTIDVSGAKVADVVTGANAYLKVALVTNSAIAEGKYAVALSKEDDKAATWWVGYKLAKTDGNVGKVLQNKKTRMGLRKAITSKTDDYDGTALVYMQVR